MSLDLTSFVDFIDRFAENWHLISANVLMSTRWDIKIHTYPLLFSNSARTAGNVVGAAGKHSPVMQASVRRRQADNREREPPRSERRLKKGNLTTTSLMGWKRQVECLSTLLINRSKTLKMRKEIKTKKTQKLLIFLFFSVISPSFPATIHRGWHEKSWPCWEFLSTAGESAVHRGCLRLIRARRTIATWFKGEGESSAGDWQRGWPMRGEVRLRFRSEDHALLSVPDCICSRDEHGSVHGLPSYWGDRLEFSQKRNLD